MSLFLGLKKKKRVLKMVILKTILNTLKTIGLSKERKTGKKAFKIPLQRCFIWLTLSLTTKFRSFKTESLQTTTTDENGRKFFKWVGDHRP